MNSTDYPHEIIVTLPETERDAVHAERLQGREVLGQVYEFTIDLMAEEPLLLEPMLGKAATLEMRVRDESATVHGVVAAARMRDPSHAGHFCYQVMVVPELAKLKYSCRNQVYGGDGAVTLPDLIEAEMRGIHKSGSSPTGHQVPLDLAYDMLLDRSDYPQLPFVLQYRETDFDFVCRLLEKYGATFRFDHTGGRERIVFIDRKAHFPAVGGNGIAETLPYRARTHAVAHDTLAVRSFNPDYTMQSGSVAMREYNWLTPGVDLDVDIGAPFEGQGVKTCYGEHYRTEAEGQFLAKRRAELLASQRLTFSGTSDIPQIRPGRYFRLDGHPDAALDGVYKIVEVNHSMTPLSQQGYESADGASRIYENSFVCIPFDTEYRPPLTTPRPIVHGFVPAVITGGPDDWGNYFVEILEEETGIAVSQPVRKAEFSTSGDGRGVSTKLEIGTEVMLMFRHGNPDRPLIVGAVSNAEQVNTITSENSEVAYLQRTRSGIQVRISDGG